MFSTAQNQAHESTYRPVTETDCSAPLDFDGEPSFLGADDGDSVKSQLASIRRDFKALVWSFNGLAEAIRGLNNSEQKE